MRFINSFQKLRLLLFLFLLIALIAVLVVGSGGSNFVDRSVLAASPTGGTVSPGSAVVTYTGGPFAGINQTDTADTATITCTPVTPCDDFALAISLPTGDPNSYTFKVTVSWTDRATVTSAHNDFDVFVYDANGNIVSGSSGATSSNPENVSISVTGGSYKIRVLPFDVNTTATGGDTYNATVTLSPVSGAPPFPTPPPPAPGVPRYQNYAAPNGLGTTAGEPSIGVDWPTGKTFMSSNTQTLRVTFDDSCSSSAKTTWEDMSAPNALTSLDPILFTDHNGLTRDRTFTSQLTGQDSLSAYTDDDGESWIPSQGGGIPSGVDHQTFGGGPYRTDMSALPPVTPPPHPLYPNAIYYCSQDSVVSFCARSDNGGLTFGPGVPIFNATQCGAIHGHVKVANDGTVYVPDKSCGGKQGFTVSKDNGLTWTVVTDPSSVNTPKLVDPSIGIGKNGTVYLAYESGADASGSFPAKVAVARRNADGTYTWSNDQVLGADLGIKNAVFPAAVSSAQNPSAVDADDNRAAVAFLGSTAAGDYTNTSFPGSWHLFISTTFDGGVTWKTVDATPNDPVQRGSICTLGTVDCNHVPDDRNLLDFMDVTIDRQGRVLVGYADGCIGGCVNGTENSYTDLATIARQSGGKRIISAFDPVEPALAGSPIVTAVSDQSGIHLSWQAPDNGGSAITGYKVYRRPETSTQRTLIANLGVQTGFDDFTAAPGAKYFYSVSVVNAAGEGPVCEEVTPVLVPVVTSCTLPGASLIQDPAGDATPANSALDIRELSVAEPFDPASPNGSRLTWTLKVESLAIVPANSQWFIIWDFGKGLRKYVAMKTDATGTPSYEYGHIGPPLSPTSPDPDANKPFSEGAADSGSISADGTITITISNSDIADNTFKGVGAPKRGSTLTNISPRTFSGTGNINVTGSTATDITASTPSYTLVGNSFCRPQTAPTAVLSAAPLSGSAPLTVNFDGSASSDPDVGDAIASYTFDFGDTNFVTQSSPTLSHTYTANGVYTAKLYVTDTRGKLSDSPATVTITVGAAPTPTPIVTCIDDNDSRIAYSNGWHAINSVSASGGHFRYHSGASSSHFAQFDFNVAVGNTGAISYSFAKSPKGGTAGVYVDGVFKQTINYAGSAGSTQAPEFRPEYRVQFGGLSAGAHTLEIRNLTGVVYVDGFCMENSSSTAQPTSGPGNTANQSGNVSGGQISNANYNMPSGSREISVVVESTLAVPFKLLMISPSGLTLQTVDAANGIAVIDAPVTQGGSYVIKVVNLSVGPLQFTTTATPLVQR
jgi:PKD repeat protein